jgi:hypothetical protein
MGMNLGITGWLKEGDIIHVGNPIRKEEYSYYKVNKIEGNKAYTKFRVFNTAIYWGKRVYEYGKRLSSYYNNEYLVVEDTNGFEPQ